MSARPWAVALIASVIASAGVAHAKRKPVAESPARKPVAESPARKLVIESFGGTAGDDARAVVLEVLAGRTDRSDYTVVGHDDVEFVAKRLKVSTDDASGRARISEELAIELWIDGELDAEGRGEVRLTTAAGKRLAVVPLTGKTRQQAGDTLRAQLWQRFGPVLSPAEQGARMLQAEQTRAKAKADARSAEYARQQQLVEKRAADVKRLLEAARETAHEKQHAREQEFARQVNVVRDLRLAQAREQQRKERELQQQAAAEQARQQQLAEQARQQQLAEEARQQRLAEQAALAQQQQAQPVQAGYAAAPSYAPAPAAASGWQQPPPANGHTPQPAPWQQQPAQPPAPGWGQPAAAAPANGYAPQPAPWQQPAQAAPSWQPQPAPWQAAPPAASGWQGGAQPQPAPAADPSVQEVQGISPETREWLQRKQRERTQSGAAH